MDFSFQKVLQLTLGGIRGEVKKHRTLFLTGQTRIHLDRVEGLSPSIFIELEVVLRDEQTLEQGQRIAEELCQRIGIEEKDRLHCAYIDLLLLSSFKEK